MARITKFGTSITKGLERLNLSPVNFGSGIVRFYSSGNGSAVKRDYDLIVIGGGSGGLACAKEAADLGKRVAVMDFVAPSPKGSSWGLGGTCVNVGCIPKKLMHQASLLGDYLKQAKSFGWNVPDNPIISWTKLTDSVKDHVKSLNWGHRVKLREKHVDYHNLIGTLRDRHTVVAYTRTDKSEEKVFTADHIVIATGMRPRYPHENEVPGTVRHAITSDDIFWLKNPPGKTLCIGASYVALEFAGFLTGFGFEAKVMVRSAPLGRFDQQMAGFVVNAMKEHGTEFLMQCVPTRMEEVNGRIKVTWNDAKEGKQNSDIFDTVIMAIGRNASTQNMGLEAVGVRTDDAGFIIGGHNNDHECSSVSNIYAIGDVLKDRPELTPVATRAGKLLARRIFKQSLEQMDYEMVPTTVFTPLEYSFVGLSEEAAIARYGADGIEVYHAFFKPLEYTIPGKKADNCYIKVITDHSPNGQIIGMHYTGPNAGEVMQGFAAALRCGLTKQKLTSTVGIHPTCAEEVVKLHITKRSGIDPTVTGC